MTYRFKFPDEATWLALGGVTGTLAGAIASAIGADDTLAAAIAGFAAVAVRFVGGFFIPEPA